MGSLARRAAVAAISCVMIIGGPALTPASAQMHHGGHGNHGGHGGHGGGMHHGGWHGHHGGGYYYGGGGYDGPYYGGYGYGAPGCVPALGLVTGDFCGY